MMSHYHKHNPLMQIVWEPYTHTLGSLPAYCTAGQHIWRAKVPLIYFWIVEGHHPERVFRQFGMKQPVSLVVDISIDLQKYPSKVNGRRTGRQNMLSIFSNGPTEGMKFVMPLSWTVKIRTLFST